jgi:transposase
MGFVGNYIRNLGSVALGREPARPLLFSYYVTHRCPWSCVYCCDGSGKPFKADEVAELSVDEAGRLLSILRRAADTARTSGRSWRAPGRWASAPRSTPKAWGCPTARRSFGAATSWR